MLIFLTLIFLRPFICTLAFPELNFFYSVVLLIFLAAYIIYRNPFALCVPALKLPLVSFCLAVSISLIFSRDQSVSLAQLYKYISAIGLFIVAASLSEKYKISAIRTIILTGVIISLLAIYQFLFSFSHVTKYLADNNLSSPFALDYLARKRVFLPFVTPGVLGGYLAMIIPLNLLSKKRIWLTPLLFIALLFTKSPVAFFSLFCALVVYFCLQGKLGKRGIFILVGMFLLIVVMFIWRSWAQKEYVQPGFSMAMRLNYWQESLAFIKVHPFVGVGPGNFNLHLSRYAHNSYLQILAEMGIFGLLSLVWIICFIFKSGFTNLKQLLYRDRLIVLLASSTAFLIQNFLDFSFFLPEVSFIWWIILGLTMI
ncbi:MAG: O-antigen ligase family protein [Candidatus Omnitrophica bacterium]|nr:O-antigen ligase family protein [Candidatus Omnitrophota bacterium]